MSDGDSPSVIVVGGTSGIGAAIAASFVATGARVHALGLRADAAPESLRRNAHVAELDVMAPEALESAIGQAPGLQVLVNAAGIIRRDAEFEPQVFAEVLQVNLVAAMRACVAAYPALKLTGGSIVNLASMLSFFGGARVPGYAASKGGIAQLTKSLAVAWGPDGIRVNAVAPGWIRTELTGALHSDSAASEQIVGRTPLGRWGEPSDVADVVAFLAGPQARFITGAIVPVDGGYLAA